MKGDLIFVLPEDHASPSGGNLYNQFLLQALREEGLSLSIADFDQSLEHAAKGLPGIFWVDSLYLSRVGRLLRNRLPRQDIFLIIHHLPSLGPAEDDAVIAARVAEEQGILRQATGFLVTSTFTRDILVSRKLLNRPILVVPPALCIAPFGRKTGTLGFRGLMVSNLIKRKGIREFLDELAKRLSQDDSFGIRIVGRFDIEPHYTEACLMTVESHPLLRRAIIFLGPLALQKLQALYEESTIFISSSRMETYGMSLHEARAFGLPILAYEAGYIKQHISPGKNGYLYGSMSELAEACIELIRRPRKLRQLRDRSHRLRTTETYSWRDAARLFLKQYFHWKR